MRTQTWNIDLSHTTVGFTVRHMVVTKVRGRFAKFAGSLDLDLADLTRSSVKVEIDAASIDTNEPKRDAHLRSADFFDVEKYPALTFASKKVTGDAEKLLVIGDLTIHGVTREVTLEAAITGQGKDPWGGERIGFEAKTRIDRREFGLHWNQLLETGGLLVSDKIDIELDVEAVAAQASVESAA
jgi:polyisoprenoid-binding protein YceI